MSVSRVGVAVALVLAAATATQAAELTLGPRLEYKHVEPGARVAPLRRGGGGGRRTAGRS